MNDTPNDTRDHDSARLLRVYLQDHYAGAMAGIALVQRCRRSNAGTPLDGVLAGIEQEIVEDRRALGTIMSRLDVEPNPLKSAAGSALELVGRLKSNGRFFSYSPSSRVVELEALAAGILTKRNLWRSLRAAAAERSALDTDELARLEERANSQLERVIAEHQRAAGEAFAPSRAAAQSSAHASR